MAFYQCKTHRSHLNFLIVFPSYNLGQNKMEQQTPIPPKSRMKAREGQKRAIFPSLSWGGRGGGGGLGFPFVLSKIVESKGDDHF